MKLFTFLSRGIINKMHRDFFFIYSSLKRGIENFLVVSRQEKNYRISLKKKKDTRNWRIFEDYLTKKKNALEVHEFNLQGIIFISAIEILYIFAFTLLWKIPVNNWSYSTSFLLVLPCPFTCNENILNTFLRTTFYPLYAASFTCTVLRIFRKFFLTCPSRPLADSAHT